MKTTNNYYECSRCGSEDLIYKSSEEAARGFILVDCKCQDCGYIHKIRNANEVPFNLQYLSVKLSQNQLGDYLTLLSDKLVGLEFSHIENDTLYRIKGVTLINHEGSAMPAVMYSSVEKDNDKNPYPFTRSLLEWFDGRLVCTTPFCVDSLSEEVKQFLKNTNQII